MSGRTVLIILVLSVTLCGNLFIFHVSASNETVYIRSDGTVDPSTAPIYRQGDLYFLNGTITSDSDGLVIQRGNLTFDGQGYSIIGSSNNQSEGGPPYITCPSGIRLEAISNITIENVSVTQFYAGILIYGYYGATDNITISNNNFVQNHDGIYLSYTGGGPTFYGNNITDNIKGLEFDHSTGNVFYHNNFIDNQAQVFGWYFGNAQYDSWDAGYPSGGNYWSDYNGTDSNKDGIGDTWYLNNNNYVGDIDGIPLNLTDHYPLMKPYSLEDTSIAPELPSVSIMATFLFVTLIIALVLTLKKKKGN